MKILTTSDQLLHPFASDAKRMEYLFELCEKYTQGMFVEGRKKVSKKIKSKKNKE